VACTRNLDRVSLDRTLADSGMSTADIDLVCCTGGDAFA
jgi:hypothetical protein